MQETIKLKILSKALKIIPFEGWTTQTLREASVKAGYDENMGNLIFPSGPISLLDFYIGQIDKQMCIEIKKLPLESMKVRDRIAAAIECRLKIVKNEKAVINKAVSFCLFPANFLKMMKFTWRTVDLIWLEAGGDKSTDFNYYTKRSLLFKVYTSTVMYWLSDDSKNYSNTISFLNRSLDRVMKLGSFLHKFKSK